MWRSLWVTFLLLACSAGQELLFSDCSLTDYYADLNSNTATWTHDELEQHLYLTHRQVVPYTSNTRADVWDALGQIDPGDGPSTVRLIYSQTSVDATVYSNSSFWNREHLWPKSHGVDYTGADYSDLHHLKPADWNVNSARNNLYFGNCVSSDCQSPAHRESAADTAKNSDIFTPPASVRGDIARALFYMDVRYGAETNNGEDLVLTDCLDRQEESGVGYMGYLSVLLQWHKDDPVSDEEVTRNLQICENWQGNRNPFVDFPDLASKFFGEPKSEPYDCSVSGSNTGPAPSPPTASTISPGDVMVVALHADNPDLVALVALAEIPRGTRIYITDNAWTGTSFLTNEGSMALTVLQAMAPGTVFGFGDKWNTVWSAPDAGFNLAAAGEQLHVYTVDESDDSILHLSSLSFNGDWATTKDELDTGSSVLPESVVKYNVVLPHFNNYVYTGPSNGSRSVLQRALIYPSNWKGSNTDTLLVDELPSAFDVKLASASGAGNAQVVMGFALLFLATVVW